MIKVFIRVISLWRNVG